MRWRSSLQRPIALAVVMLMLLGVLTVGWVLLNVFRAVDRPAAAGWHWAFLAVGTVFILMLVVGVVLYLTLSLKAINLNRRQTNFIDSVTHELKSPLASMKLYLQTLDRHEVSAEQRATFRRFMREDLDRLDRLINQVLEAGRVESQRIDGQPERVDLPPLLNACGESVCLNHRTSPAIITWHLAPCAVHARPVELELIFRNLIDNAVKYAGTPPRVEVTLETPTPRKAVVRIADNGKGIPPEFRRKVFRRFVRLGNELERDRPGTGLGLYIVQTLVKKLGGRIRVHGRDDAPGAVFEVELPTES